MKVFDLDLEPYNMIKIGAFDTIQFLIGRKALTPHAIKLLYLFIYVYKHRRQNNKDIKLFHGAKEVKKIIDQYAKNIRTKTGRIFFSTQNNLFFKSWKELEDKKLIERVNFEKDYFDNEILYPPKEQIKLTNKTWKKIVRPTGYKIMPIKGAYISPLTGEWEPIKEPMYSDLEENSLDWGLVEVTLQELFLGDFFHESESNWRQMT